MGTEGEQLLAGVVRTEYNDLQGLSFIFNSVPCGIFCSGSWVSASAWLRVGYIALFGISVETGVVMIVYLHEALETRLAHGVPLIEADLEKATFFLLIKRRERRRGKRHSQTVPSASWKHGTMMLNSFFRRDLYRLSEAMPGQ